MIDGRTDLLRAGVWGAFRDKAETGKLSRETVERLVAHYIEWPVRRVDVDAALELLRESTALVEEAAVLRELRRVGVELCVMCEAPKCKGGPDCTYRQRIASGMPDHIAKWKRGQEWMKVIAEREARRVA